MLLSMSQTLFLTTNTTSAKCNNPPGQNKAALILSYSHSIPVNPKADWIASGPKDFLRDYEESSTIGQFLSTQSSGLTLTSW